MSVLENMTAWHSQHSILDLEHVPVPGAASYTVGAKCVCFFFFLSLFPYEIHFSTWARCPFSPLWKVEAVPEPTSKGRRHACAWHS